MAQHNTYDIPDQSGTAFRSDLNDYLRAVVSQNAGDTEPANPLAGVFWYDTANHLLKIRNSTNTAWTTVASSVTGEVNFVTTTSSTAKVNGFNASSTKTANTIVQRDASGNVLADVIGNVPNGDAQTIGGFTPAQLQDMDNVVGREYVTITAGNSLLFAHSLIGSEERYFKIPFSGTYRVFIWVRNSSFNNGISVFSGSLLLQALSSQTVASFPTSQAPTAVGAFYSLYTVDTTLAVGDIVNFSGINGTNNGTIVYGLGSAEYGFEFDVQGTTNLGDVADSLRQTFTELL